nr:PRA1 family protein A1-like [Tanacetum cinerariifolium]
MDWGSVTTEDLIEALKEVDWSSPPRPFNEFFSKFTFPRSTNKWNSRLKCNLYYYRTNYFLMILFILGLGFLRRPLAIVAALSTALTIAFLNDRRPVLRGRPSSKRSIYICGRPRWAFVLAFSAVSFFLWFVSCGLLTLSWALTIGLLATISHASFRTPNLKARLNTFREEFRAVWRNYSDI